MTNDTSHYIIQGGESGADRLKILANVMWPFTEPFLQRAGLRDGMKCLDVGCGSGELTRRIADIIGETGHVTGIDFDGSVIAIAQQQSTAYSNITFRERNIEKDDPPRDTYDFIFCRFILSHLQSPMSVIQKLKSSLRPNGIIAVEDVDFKGHFSFPHAAAFDTYVNWYTEIGLRKGGNPHIGPSILSMLNEAGLRATEFSVVAPTFYRGDGKRMALLTMQAIRNTIVEEGLATREEADAVIHDLDVFTREDNSIISMPRIFQVAGV